MEENMEKIWKKKKKKWRNVIKIEVTRRRKKEGVKERENNDER